MEKLLTVFEIIIPIFVTIFLGMLAKRKKMISEKENKGLQQFVMKFGLPCVLFNSCLTANLGAESLTSMVLLMPLILISTLWSFWARKNCFHIITFPCFFVLRKAECLEFLCL